MERPRLLKADKSVLNGGCSLKPLLFSQDSGHSLLFVVDIPLLRVNRKERTTFPCISQGSRLELEMAPRGFLMPLGHSSVRQEHDTEISLLGGIGLYCTKHDIVQQITLHPIYVQTVTLLKRPKIYSSKPMLSHWWSLLVELVFLLLTHHSVPK